MMQRGTLLQEQLPYCNNRVTRQHAVIVTLQRHHTVKCRSAVNVFTVTNLPQYRFQGI